MWQGTRATSERVRDTFGKCKFFTKGQFSRSSSSLRPIILVYLPWLICLRTLPGVCMHTLAKLDLKVKASGRSKIHYGLELSCEF